MQTVTREQMAEIYRAAFAQCHDPADWKGPIDVVVPNDLANLYMQAIEFMTGVKPEAKQCILEGHLFGGYRLTCVGYRAGPCGG